VYCDILLLHNVSCLGRRRVYLLNIAGSCLFEYGTCTVSLTLIYLVIVKSISEVFFEQIAFCTNIVATWTKTFLKVNHKHDCPLSIIVTLKTYGLIYVEAKHLQKQCSHLRNFSSDWIKIVKIVFCALVERKRFKIHMYRTIWIS